MLRACSKLSSSFTHIVVFDVQLGGDGVGAEKHAVLSVGVLQGPNFRASSGHALIS